MADFVSKRDLQFLLYEVFNAESLTSFQHYQDHSSDTFNMIIDTALNIGTELMYPLFSEMDKKPPVFEDGIAKVHPGIRTFLDEIGNGGWINADWDYELGGQQLPAMVKFISVFIFSAANYSMSVYPLLTAGASNLIREFASQELQQIFLEKLCSAEWQGTMALTEPNVGSSLGDINTTAKSTDHDYYLIKGKKIFISAADTDQVSNTIHMTLARLSGGPAGVKGISLFLVPKYRINNEGDFEFNDVICNGIEHKLGYKGSPICELAMGENNDCHGYLVGDLGKGLAYMFQMMNEERINVGIGAIAKATAAYYAALEYTRQRLQGRKLGEKDPTTPMIPLLEHADIKRMLLFQRSICEGSLSLALQVSQYMDLAKTAQNAGDKEKFDLLMELLVPIVKTYPAEMGILSTSAAIQCLGGYGYCQDFPVEQYFRDIRIDTIHEGTTGIQGQDILGRKVTMKNGKALDLFIEEVRLTVIRSQKYENLSPYADELLTGLYVLKKVTEHFQEIAATGNVEEFLADATLYLELFSIISIAWQWLEQAIAASNALSNRMLSESDERFYNGKLYTFKFFYRYELSKIISLSKTLMDPDRLTSNLDTKYF